MSHPAAPRPVQDGLLTGALTVLQRIFTTYTFRFMLMYVLALSITVTVLLAVVYAFYSYEQFSRVQASVALELEALQQRYLEQGAEGVAVYVGDQHARPGKLGFFYLLVDGNKNRLAGDLAVWPEFREFGSGWLAFERQVLWGGNEAESGEFMARTLVLPDGNQLLVARYYSDLMHNAQLMLSMTLNGMLITVVLGVIGGAWTSLTMLREIESINRGVKNIMDGDLSERIPISGRGGDIEVLVANFNRLLDRVQALMAGVRQVSDNIAHDLRTPLTRLRNHLSGLERQSRPEQREAIQAMLAEADALLATFSGLLRIAQVESGHRRSAFRPLDLPSIVQDVVEFYEPLAQQKDQLLQADLAAGIRITGDRDLLFQALANLLDNAIKYTPVGGRIRVCLERIGSQARIVIADSGPGIAEEKRSKVFERFYRIEASRSQEPGNGLGLSLVAAVIKLHDGRIELADNRPGLQVSLYLML